MFLRKSWISETENVSTQGGLEPPTFEFMPDALLIELLGPDICYPLFWNTGSGGMDIFVCKVNIWNVSYVQATPFISEAYGIDRNYIMQNT